MNRVFVVLVLVSGSMVASRLAAQTGGPADSPRLTAEDVLEAAKMVRDGARPTVNANNLKQLALALITYLDVQKHFPPAAVVRTEGAPPHSWRVEILPYLDGGAALYKTYHFDEPWDSEHNRTLLDKMPSVFRSPFDNPKSTNTSYFMPTGKGVIGDGKGARIKDIRDGTSRTILVIDAKRDIPWTKPEDIEIDADEAKPLPKFGFDRPNGLFTFALADGSVRSGVNSVDPKVLRLMFTIADGQVLPPEYREQTVLGQPNPVSQPASGSQGPAKATGLFGGLLQNVEAQRESGRQAMSLNNAKQLVLGLLSYEAAHKRFPSAVVMGKDGKTPHSWRVEILPYIEEQALYNQYRLDEPWDSENNRKLIDNMPSVFLDPFDDPKSKNASYFMPTGKGTIGEGPGKRSRDIRDGTSNTVLVLEAKRDIPWTKPEDVELDPDPAKPLPKFGFGRPSGEFVVAMVDGSCRGALESLDPKVLRALLTVAGGEVIPQEFQEEYVMGRKNPPPEPEAPMPRLPDPRKIDLSKLRPAEQAKVRREISENNLKQ